MFELTHDYAFERTVSVRRPSPSQKDKIIVDTFTAKVRAVDPDELERLEERVSKSVTVMETVEAMIDYAAEVTTGWDGVVSEREPVPFEPETFRRYLRVSWFRDGVIAAYRSAMRGEEARRGN